jgi:DNA polymerase zeta
MDQAADDEAIPGFSFSSMTASSNGLKKTNSITQLLEIEDVFYTPPDSRKQAERRKRSASPLGSQRPSKNARIDAKLMIGHPKPVVRFASEVEVRSQSTLNGSSSTDNKRSINSFEYAVPAPSRGALLESMATLEVPSKIYRDPFFSNTQDVPDQPFEHGGRRFILKGGVDIGALEPWEDEDEPDTFPSSSPASVNSTGSADMDREPLQSEGVYGWEYASMPPSRKQTEMWLKESKSQHLAELKRRRRQSQVCCTLLIHTILTDLSRSKDPLNATRLCLGTTHSQLVHHQMNFSRCRYSV